MEQPVSSNHPPAEVERWPFPWVTWIIVVTTVLVFLVQLVVHHIYSVDKVGDALAYDPDALREHRYWTLVTYAWAHATTFFDDSRFFWLHIASNLFPLICLGPLMEEMLGHGRFLGLYLGGAVASVLVWGFFNAQPDESIIGASGAVFAVMGAVAFAAPQAPVTVYLLYFLPAPRIAMSVAIVIACAIEGLQIVFQHIPALSRYSMPEVAHSAHLGGAIFGFIYAWLFLPKESSDLSH